ncbi:adenylate/guanylate cyclase domain-containing protein [Mycobacterium sp. 1245805.9]|uniref:adenylate/guanylate cyclase domain-containing protein n=1 Tax=Mycobacterium sp. 1245805.9 TaxID=1856862 RepID=UPI0007FEAD92|nr:adenylate/guanylate cyclase domain-containing protein [Mycobacterium sp. 1245805.9]OBI94304.1 cyclase [Mycobacterium sp. 1245805.9]
MAGTSAAPRIRYAKCGDIDIAYQVFGEGPVDLVLLAGPSIPIDSIDAEPSLYRFYRRLASFSRVIRFDFRGMGLSSRVPSLEMIGPRFWAEDAIAVMDAVGCGQAAVLATSYNAMSGLVLAADYPGRVRSLVIVNGTARVSWAPDYPIGSRPSATDPYTTVAMETDAVEQGFDVLASVAPSVARDDAFRTWWDVAGNRAASPSMARAVSKVVTESDVRDTLPRIGAKTLILHRDRVQFISADNGRYLAQHIAGSRYVALPGEDSLYWVGDAGPMLGEIEEFITGVRGGSDSERVLTTIVFTDIVGGTQRAAELGDQRWRDLLDRHDTMVRREIRRFGGTERNRAGDGFLATFVSPSAAISFADAIVDAVRVLGVELRVGIHAGEIEVRGNDIAGLSVHIGARVSALAGPSEVLVSSTLRDIVAGSGRAFAARGEYELKGVPDVWRLYALVREKATTRR